MKLLVSISKLLALALATIVVACSENNLIESRAKSFVRSTYNDVDRIIYVSIDTVTVGDNLDFRIKQADLSRMQAETALQSTIHYAKEMERYGANYTSSIESATERLAEQTAWCAALDSLKASLGDELNEVAAYNCIVTYNRPGNMVWVQLDPFGRLLQISKDAGKRLLNPGGDAPGYLDVWEKHRQKNPL